MSRDRTRRARTGRRTRIRACGSLVVAQLTLLILLSGCSAAGAPAPAGGADDPTSAPSATEPSATVPVATPAVPGMRALAVRLRTDLAVGGQFQTRITNTGSEPFTVLAVSLDSPGFERLPFAGRPAVYNPGATIDLPTRYGPARCGDRIGVAPAFSAVQIQREGGRTEELRVPLEAPDNIVDRIHREECHALSLAAAVDVALGGPFATTEMDGKTVVQATITLTRRDSTEEIALTELRGSVVLYVLFADEEDAPATMAVGESSLEIAVVLSITGRTCDPHVLSETKQPFLFPFFLSFDGGEPQYGTVDVSPEQREALWSYIQAVCAEGLRAEG